MKITDIKCYVTESTKTPPSFHWREGLPYDDALSEGDKTYGAVLKVETDEGIVGRSGGGRAHYLADVTRRRLKQFIGSDPLMTEKLWHEIWEIDRLEEFQVHALGALDIACWDIKAQKSGLPLFQLLGGYESRVPAYASTVTWDTMDEYEKHIKECMDEGFTAFKLHAWGDPVEDARLSRNLRKWTGDEADLMFDGSAGWDYATSMKVGRVLEEADFLWYEEPMREFDLPSYAELCRSLDIPVLAAETSDGCHWNAATWIQYRALDMMRISAAFKGGITGAIKTSHLAESFGMRAQVHGLGSVNAHLCAAIPNNDYGEVLVIDTEQIQGLKNRKELPIVDGYFEVPDSPGFTAPIDWDHIEKNAVMVV
ncbi:MAG: enolase C-terminal domain-like protein [Planctomycetota bacterium]|jgi:L-alanine-DL-glutamate epimerase-like enolase superfamily enzyme|nr:enolase C-terminal domain-like protein [Planctomycetota bacterium]MDP7249877.1 enolase C-terminal domain-like protein [Planctomycetota bacterium]